MDITQIIISVSLLSISTVIVISGIYLIKILRELRSTVTITNTILEDAKSITTSVSRPISSFSEFIMGFKNGFNLLNSFFKKKKSDSTNKESV